MPFGKFARRYESVLVFYILDHMFCFVDIEDFTYVNVRSTPGRIDYLKLHYTSVDKPVNQSMKYWVKLNFGGDVPDVLIHSLIDEAYKIVKEKHTPKSKRISKKANNHYNCGPSVQHGIKNNHKQESGGKA